jgi:hypothetical protein
MLEALPSFFRVPARRIPNQCTRPEEGGELLRELTLDPSRDYQSRG